MERNDVKQHIKTGQLDKFYIFYGCEHAIMKIYIKMMAEKAGLDIVYADSVTDLMTGARTKSLVKVNHLYIVMDDKEFLDTEKMWDKFKGLKDDVVVFYYSTADKRKKFWKHFKDKAVEFTQLDTRILTKYIQKEAPFNDKDCELLIDLCANDYGRILLEIDKVKAYSRALAITADSALHELIDKGVIYRQPYDAIFDFVAAFLERRPSKAYNLLQQSKDVGEANMVLLSVLYNNIKTLLQVQSAKDYKALGLNGFAVKNVIAYKGNYSNAELVKAMKLIRQVEKGIKTGTVPDELSVEYVMVSIM